MAATTQSMEMEKYSTFLLNYDCWLEIFLLLGFDDCMNLAEVSQGLQPIADRVYNRKFNELEFDFKQAIDRVLYHAGPTARSLTLTFSTSDNVQSDLIKIGDTCKELRCLTLNKFNSQKGVDNPLVKIAAEHLEVLTLNQCSIANDKDIFDTCKSLKCLNLIKCGNIEIMAMVKCFKSNPEISSLICDSQFYFYPKLFQLLPNLEKLSLRYNSKFMKLNALSKLQSLRHLTLLCWVDNVNDILANLAKVNRLEELVLVDVVTDENTFPLIKSLQKLQLLTVTTGYCRFPNASDLPTDLKALKLGGFVVAENDFALTIKQLKSVEAIHLENCELEHDGYTMRDFDTIADYIVEEVTGEQPDRQLSVSVVSFDDNSTETIVAARRVWITNYVVNEHLFKVSYPGADDY